MNQSVKKPMDFTAWKVSKYGVISGPYLFVLGLNTEIYFVNLVTQSENRKIRTRNNSVFGYFSRSALFEKESGKCFCLLEHIYIHTYIHHTVSHHKKSTVFCYLSIEYYGKQI